LMFMMVLFYTLENVDLGEIKFGESVSKYFVWF